MNTILAVAIACTAVASTQTVKECVEYERVKLKSYKEACAEHEKTKRPVIVWVGEVSMDVWKVTKDQGIHCYMRDFPGSVVAGVVVGKDYKGTFCQFGIYELEYAKKKDRDTALLNAITNALNAIEPMQSAPPPQVFQFQPRLNCYGKT